LEDCIAAVETATARRDCLEAHIKSAVADWSLAPVVQAMQALRGMALVAAATLVAELGDISRFANPRQLMAYVGLVPSEHSSGATRRRHDHGRENPRIHYQPDLFRRWPPDRGSSATNDRSGGNQPAYQSMINRRFLIVPPALPSGGHAEQLAKQAKNFRACCLKWRT
jgi:hypothetical protein